MIVLHHRSLALGRTAFTAGYKSTSSRAVTRSSTVHIVCQKILLDRSGTKISLTFQDTAGARARGGVLAVLTRSVHLVLDGTPAEPAAEPAAAATPAATDVAKLKEFAQRILDVTCTGVVGMWSQ